MNVLPTLPLTFQYGSATEVNRAILDREGITIEARGVIGGFQPWQRVFWEEVRTLYVWEGKDWNTITAGLLLGLVAWLVGLGLFASGSKPLGILFWGLIGLAVIGWGLLTGIRLRPRRWFRLETGQGPLLFHTRREEVLTLILERLGVGDQAEAVSTSRVEV